MTEQLGINPPLDKFALDNGLGHWSCLSPDNNNVWIREDGKKCYVIKEQGVLLSLRNADIDSIIENEYIEKIEKVIVSNGCHDCPFVQTRNDYCTVGRDNDQGLNINGYFLNKEFHPECPLLSASIKVSIPPKQA